MTGKQRRAVEIIKMVFKKMRVRAEKTRIRASLVPLYGDNIWQWLRCFIAIWAGIIFSAGLPLAFESLLPAILLKLEAYGLVRFWVFYTPVFGFFLQKFYSDYTNDGC